jgi:hypothetical protein
MRSKSRLKNTVRLAKLAREALVRSCGDESIE